MNHLPTAVAALTVAGTTLPLATSAKEMRIPVVRAETSAFPEIRADHGAKLRFADGAAAVDGSEAQ
jgi:hypothetical protein